MARLPRIHFPGIPQHVVVRGNNRVDIFRDEQDRGVFLRYLDEARRSAECSLHAFVLMSNHVHLLVTAAEVERLSDLMQSTGRRYSRYFNTRYQRTGTLFEGRYRSSVVQSERYFLTCMKYIEENPVRAGMVARPDWFRWSSHSQNATGSPQGMVNPHQEYLRLGRDAVTRGTQYRGLFRVPVPQMDLDVIRESLGSNRVLGDEGYRKAIEKALGRPAGIPTVGRPRKPEPDLFENVT